MIKLDQSCFFKTAFSVLVPRVLLLYSSSVYAVIAILKAESDPHTHVACNLKQSERDRKNYDLLRSQWAHFLGT